ncbi:GPI mannosyltransferase 1 [Aspergillus udagawae]|uniref:GPI mannosyltransferase 1 n=1 Tax=Aspergillus udagawae TaxID=91492 RepID=A0ABQ1BF22_9EURO|nr:GPI mannosyltransferase 1 [Aspergillus udagawae]GFG00576.1 GPI mannosyltransferase 1 [Aspergillus udagawae]GFG04315.1 GPI mannosyltransferase 1 [Aspergillus udagawae]GFG20772.1 GPI mannosyltransferase 1 [Aspergillus udagawae]
MTSFFSSPTKVIGASIALRAVLLVYGAWQDAHSPIKYTDIDYLVFTDAARYVSRGASPYARDTYRYTPLLAWLLLPTAWDIPGFFSFGKALFALADVVAGWLIARVLVSAYGMSQPRALKYASVWLLNPMVANISTRGSSEGLLGVLVVGLLWAVLSRRVTLAGVILGLGVHFKIYPFIYGPAVLWWLDAERDGSPSATATAAREKERNQDITSKAINFLTPARIHLTLVALATFSALNVSMYILYGLPFAHHTYLHHLTRIDHRHNFSPYSTLLYLSAAGGARTAFESLAFIPQLLLAVVVIPLALGKKSLAGTMLAQTFAFVTFNKVCTSQYFLWYLVFLPFYLPSSSLMKKPRKGVLVGLLWVVAQALWLQQGYNLEFLGLSSFVPGLFLASLFFFVVNVWILGIIVEDVGDVGTGSA